MRISLFFLCLYPAILWANPEITVPLPEGVSMEFVRIEPGTFLMGTSQEQKDEWDRFNARVERDRPTSFANIFYTAEFPQHPVTITKAFYLGKYEVTRGQWFAVMGEEGEVWFPRVPIGSVSWIEIQDFMAILNEESERTFRLPTEAEWEYAARAGTETLWWCGDDPAQALRHLCRGIGAHRLYCDVDANPKYANPWGLYHVMGNVFEFTSHGFRAYENKHEIDPVGLQLRETTRDGGYTNYAMMRGGDVGVWGLDWPRLPDYACSACRISWRWDRKDPIVGFRVLLEDHIPTNVKENKSWGGVKKTIEELEK